MNQSWFCGYLRSFSATTGYGFVHNEELQQRYSRDVYVHASLLPAGIVCGAKVSFTFGLNERGQPQCRQVWEEDTTELDENAMFQLLPVPLELEVCSTSKCMEGAVSRLLSWNILAPSYCNGAYFKDVHPDAFRWSRRACQIKALLFSLCPEIICLQEVELHRLHDLGLSNYEMVSVQRPGTSRGTARFDGCGIAWLADRFRLLRKHEVFFDQYLIEKQEEEGDRNLTGHVALLVELLPLPSSPTTGSGLAYQPLLVATTHLACGEELEEQRLAQAKILLQAIEEFGHQSQVVLCGDLNCLPTSQTYQFLSQRGLHSAYEDLEDPSFDLCTATNANVRDGFAEIIDYCFLWDRGAALNRWRPPSKTLLRQQLGDENPKGPVPTLMRGGHWPSDHFPVVVDVALSAQCLQ